MKIIFNIFTRLNQKNKRRINHFLRKTSFRKLPVYKKLKFNGIFDSTLPDGKKFKMYHHGGDIENETFWQGPFKTWESDSGWIWMELCKISQVIFDIGANTGIYGLTAKSINSEARVYCFEPSENTFVKLQNNVVLNGNKIKCEKLAISNKTGYQTFYDFPWQNQTGATLSEDKVRSIKNQVVQYKVKTQTLSSYITDNNIEKLDLIKLDIEMHEAEAIEGLGNYLDWYKPLMLIEVLDKTVAEKLNNLINLEEFDLYHLCLNGEVEKLNQFQVYPKSLSQGDWNYLVFHKCLESKLIQNTTIFNRLKSI